MPLWSTWLRDRPYDSVVVLFIILLVISAFSRTGEKKTNRSLLWANWCIVFVLLFSLKPVYSFLDPLLGGHNLINLAQRIGAGLAGVAVTKALSQMCMSYFREDILPKCAHWGWNVVVILGSIVSFAVMGAATNSSRGLDQYSHQLIAYPAYQLFTFLGLIVGIPYLVPRLLQMFERTSNKLRKAQTALFATSYVLSPVAIVFYALTPVGGIIIPLREMFVYLVPITLTVAFMIAVKNKNILLTKKQVNS